MKIAKIFLFLITLSLFFIFTRSKYALSASSSNNLHTNTKIYSSNNNDYFYGCNDYADYVDIQPSITVLTHGFGSRGYFWSNNPTINDGKSFALNESSLVYKIFERFSNVKLYGPVCQGLERAITDLSRACSAERVFDTIALTVVQAQALEKGDIN